jgi:hypothetical protein
MTLNADARPGTMNIRPSHATRHHKSGVTIRAAAQTHKRALTVMLPAVSQVAPRRGLPDILPRI